MTVATEEPGDEWVQATARQYERDLWDHVIDHPTAPHAMHGACELAALALWSRALTIAHGCSREHAEAFITNVDDLALRLDQLGGHQRLARAVVLDAYVIAADFANVLLDLLRDGSE